ncbi:hypothetical protein SARC_02664 [Sphaeroforma arctica JP610]|uniref:Uncharacterized protein n=1 Tax=Sphaeroforma arctica JP610 TaxID=667725 RepID=A0A0L0G823_9EUKA|nr:hypothetical protein SARC_02664 [Sphaeroforma arctica JP610]KNC85140.1 hypothetical protein SARC_02664 [Sphaeroforma arctica JP610]|eukprot:XP_014159042.1 hypothetical protein SARC_02664 [Sphaeroforma arctica JP610]
MLYDAEDNPSPRGRPRRTSSDRLARPYRSRSSSPLAEVSLAQDAHATDPSHHLPTHETTATFGEIRPRIIRGTTFEILRTAVRTEKDPENICIALVNIGNLVYYHMLQYASVATETNRDTGFATDANSPLAGMTRQKSWLDPPEKHAQGQFRNTETSFQSPPHPPPSGNHDNRRASYTTAANEEKSYQGMVMLLVDTLLGQLNVPAPHNIVCDMVIAQLSLLPDVIGPFVTSQDMNDLDAGDAPDKGAWAALGRLSFLLYTEVMANFSDAIMTALSLDAHSAEEQRLKDNRITRLLFALMDWAMITPNTAKATITTRHRAQKSSSLSKLDATGYSPKVWRECVHVCMFVEMALRIFMRAYAWRWHHVYPIVVCYV